jgi:hypothetical protein
VRAQALACVAIPISKIMLMDAGGNAGEMIVIKN